MRHRPSFRTAHRESRTASTTGRHAGTTTAPAGRGGLLTAPEHAAPLSAPEQPASAPEQSPEAGRPAQRRRRPAGPPNPTVGRLRAHARAHAARDGGTRHARTRQAGTGHADLGPAHLRLAGVGHGGLRHAGSRRRAVPAPQRRRRAPHDSLRTMQLVMTGIAAAIMLSVCGLSGFFIVADERRGHGGTTAKAPARLADRRDISSRVVDPRPLTVDEVFPGSDLTVADRTYRVQMTHSDTDCHITASGEVDVLLGTLGCTQVIRATLLAPEEGYLLTAGVFNLADEAGATLAHQQIKTILDQGRGRFGGMTAGEGTAALATAPAQFGWHTRGHFLAYCVLVRADGQPIAEDDPTARQILYDAVEVHLREGVLGRRAAAPDQAG
jgi:hypothetical protein